MANRMHTYSARSLSPDVNMRDNLSSSLNFGTSGNSSRYQNNNSTNNNNNNNSNNNENNYESENEEDDEFGEEELKAEEKRRQAQKQLREAQRNTARKSLLLANLVGSLEPSLAQEIIDNDVNPYVTTTLQPPKSRNGAVMNTPQSSSTSNGNATGVVQKKFGTWNSDRSTKGTRLNPAFMTKNRKARASVLTAINPPASYTVQYAAPRTQTFQVEASSINSNGSTGIPKFTKTPTSNNNNRGDFLQRNTRTPRQPQSQQSPQSQEPLRNSSDEDSGTIGRAQGQKMGKSTKSKITSALKPFWNKDKEKKPVLTKTATSNGYSNGANSATNNNSPLASSYSPANSPGFQRTPGIEKSQTMKPGVTPGSTGNPGGTTTGNSGGNWSPAVGSTNTSGSPRFTKTPTRVPTSNGSSTSQTPNNTPPNSTPPTSKFTPASVSRGNLQFQRQPTNQQQVQPQTPTQTQQLQQQFQRGRARSRSVPDFANLKPGENNNHPNTHSHYDDQTISRGNSQFRQQPQKVATKT